ncbi:2OG-Fe(II) oxygenase [Streptomyces sp. NPDC051567]|uniref:2OG-Fe(II) oxygenase n=1 Tax=Streptomyces sp. NPDC051567 TaxID=3365660 RepID=UPI0037967DE8
MLNLNATFVHMDSPYTLHVAQNTLTKDEATDLFTTAPIDRITTISRTDPTSEKQYRMNLTYLMVNGKEARTAHMLPAPWRTLFDDLVSDRFTRWLSAGTGIELGGLSRDMGIYTHVDGDYISVHKDKPEKAITAILYLNDSWPSDGGGEFEVRMSADAGEPPALSLPPRPGRLLAFPPTDSSWHSVSTVRTDGGRPRLTVQLEYWFAHEDRYSGM